MQPTLFDMSDISGAPAGTIFATPRKSPPHFYRCPACCEVFTLETQPVDRFRVVCACGSTGLDYLGQAGKAGKLVKDVDRCPCDARCTNATGPHCDCVCMGANHGTQRVVRVQVITGNVPVIVLSDPEAAKARVAEFKRESEAAEQRVATKYGEQYATYRAGKWLTDKAAWMGIADALTKIRDARKLKVHKNRIAALRKVCSQ